MLYMARQVAYLGLVFLPAMLCCLCSVGVPLFEQEQLLLDKWHKLQRYGLLGQLLTALWERPLTD